MSTSARLLRHINRKPAVSHFTQRTHHQRLVRRADLLAQAHRGYADGIVQAEDVRRLLVFVNEFLALPEDVLWAWDES
jgi:hypothetical protein